MTSLPRFIRGNYGDLRHYHLNRAFSLLEGQEGDEKSVPNDGDKRNVNEYEERDDHALTEILQSFIPPPLPGQLFPFRRKLSWDEATLDEDRKPVDAPGAISRRSGSETNNFATLPSPKFGRMFFQVAPEEVSEEPLNISWLHRAVYYPNPSIVAAEITSVAFPPPTYTVRSICGGWDSLAEQMTPIDRWPGIEYVPRFPGDFVLLLLVDDLPNFSDSVKLVAFESPDFASCPAGAAAGTTVNSWMGL